jgi:hypothetical protein
LLHGRVSIVTARAAGAAVFRPGFDAQGNRIRRRETAATKTAAFEAMAASWEELGQAPRSSRAYTLWQAVDDWLADGLRGLSKATREAYRYALAPVLARTGHRPLRELTALELRSALEFVSGKLTTRTLSIARNSLERAIRHAQVHQRVNRNVAALIETPSGKTGRKSKVLTLSQAQALLQAAEGERIYPYIRREPCLRDPHGGDPCSAGSISTWSAGQRSCRTSTSGCRCVRQATPRPRSRAARCSFRKSPS